MIYYDDMVLMDILRDIKMTAKVDNKKDILLLLLYSPGKTEEVNEPVIGRTRLVKMIFLFQKEYLSHFKKGTELSEENFYKFFPWDFGPFSKEIYDDIMFFSLRDFINDEVSDEELLPEAAAEWQEWMRLSSIDENNNNISEYDEKVYKLSEKGLTFTKELYQRLSNDQKKSLKIFKEKINKAPLKVILKYVYETYPDFTTESKIKDKVIGKK